MTAAFLPIGEAAKLLEVSEDTLRYWEKQGKIKSYKNSRGFRLYSQPEIQALRQGFSKKVADAAKLLQVSPTTLRRLSNKGEIPFNQEKNGYRYYRLADLETYLLNHAKPISPLLQTKQNKPVVAESEPNINKNIEPVKNATEEATGHPRLLFFYRSSLIGSVLLFFLCAFFLLHSFINKPLTEQQVPYRNEVFVPETTSAAVLGLHQDTIVIPIQQLIERGRNLLAQFIVSLLPQSEPTPSGESSPIAQIQPAIGRTGPTGATGIGRNSTLGPTGATGSKGDKGDQGNAGANGLGESGATGSTGPVGATGAGGTADSLFAQSGNLLYPGTVVDRSLALGNTTGGGLTTTSTSSARIYLDATTGSASISGSLTLGNGQAIRSAYGPVQLQYKSGIDSYTTGLYLQDTTGNIGIGTTSPASRLDIQGGFGGNAAVRINQTNTGDIFTASSSATPRFTITNAGNVGIGTTTPTGLLETYSTVTSLGTNGLGYMYWNPSAAATFSGDVFAINAGANATITGSLFNVKNNGSSLFSVTPAKITSALPHEFTSAGDVSFAYDITLTNPTSGAIRSLGPFTLEAGPVYSNNDITLKTNNSGTVVIDSRSLSVGGGPVRGLLTVDNTIAARIGKALFTLNQTENQDILAASSSGTLRFLIANNGNVGIATTNPASRLDVQGGFAGNAAVTVNQTNAGDIFTASSSGTPRFTITNAGNVGIGTTTPTRNLFIQAPSNAAIAVGSSSTNYGYLAWTNGSAVRLETPGYFFPVEMSGNIFSVLTAGTERFRITNTGATGIGTTSPASRLDVQGGFEGNAAVTVNQTNAGDIFTASSSGTPRFTITNAGNVGIGTTNPSSNFHVFNNSNGSVSVDTGTGNIAEFRLLEAGAAKWTLLNRGSDLDKFQIAGQNGIGQSLFLTLDQSGLLGLGTTSPASRLDVQGGFAGNAAVTVNQTNAGDIFTASSSGTPRFTITNAGDVGIGTITPAQRLQVAGDVRVGTGTDGCVEDADGTLIAGACSSDIQLKENIVALPAMLNKLTSLTAVTYTWKSGYNKGSQAEIGIIAQDVERVLPQLVTVGADGYKRVRFQYIPIVLLQGVKELAAKVDALETSPLQLQQQLAQQSTQLSQLAQQLERVEQKTLPENNATVSAVLSETTQRLTALEEEVGKLANKTVSNTSSFSLSSTESAVLKLVSTGDEPMATTSGLWIDHQLTVLGSTSLADAIIAGNVLIAGTIRITPSGLVDINGELTLQGTVTIDDSGKLTAPRVTTQELRTRSFVTVNGHTAGKAVVAATQSAQTIETAAVTPESLIFINSRNTSENLLRITEQKQGSFTVERTGPQTESIPFDWFVIQIEHDIKEEEQP